MDATELKKTVDAHIKAINSQMETIDANIKKRNAWAGLYNKIKANPSRTDESVLEEMTYLFGENCLKALVVSVAEGFVKDFDEKISSQSFGLKDIINHGEKR